MNLPIRSTFCASAIAFTLLLPAALHAAGVSVGASSLIGTLDYSDTFTGTDSGGRPGRPYQAAIQAPAAYVIENNYSNPVVSFSSPGQPAGIGEFSFASDNEALGRPGFVQGTPNYPPGTNASGAGSDTGFTQTGGGGTDWSIPYALRLQYVVQMDAIQVPDRIDIGSTSGVGIFTPNSLTVFFRGDGSGNASLYNGSTDTPIQGSIAGFNTGITAATIGQWNNYGVRFDLPGHQVELFVNQNSVGVIDLTTFAGGLYDNFSNANVTVGAGVGAGDRTWTDNFQVGAPVPEPGSAVLVFAGVTLAGLRRRRQS